MIVLEIGQLNNVSEICSRNSELDSPVYLWSFYHKLSSQTWRVIPYQTPWAESYKSMFDTFNIGIYYDSPQSLTGNTNPNDTNVHLIEGDYWISIYEQKSTTNLDPTKSFNKVVETFGYVVPTNTTNPTYGSTIYEYKVYEND